MPTTPPPTPFDDIVLEQECSECSGRGERMIKDIVNCTSAYKDCSKCQGTGYIMTDLGRKVLQFALRIKKRMDFYQ